MVTRSPPNPIIKKTIAAFGGPTKLSRILSEEKNPTPISTIHAWPTCIRGIPRLTQRALIDIAKRRDINLPPEFVEMAA